MARLFGISSSFVARVGSGNGAVGNHYRAALEATFSSNKEAEYLIVLEEDILLAPDTFR